MNLNPKEAKPLTLYSLLVVAVTILSGGGWSVAIWAADQRYVTHETMDEYFTAQQMVEVKEVLADLESVKKSELTVREKGKLKRAVRLHTELLQKKT